MNKTTGEIEIINNITAKGSASDDADSYIATGVLKAYNTRTAEVNIDGQKYPLGYASLKGSIYGNVAENMKSMTLAAQSLDEFQMQYVTYVVVDGRVVDIDLKNNTTDIVVVLGYAGITSDDYIASTASLPTTAGSRATIVTIRRMLGKTKRSRLVPSTPSPLMMLKPTLTTFIPKTPI